MSTNELGVVQENGASKVDDAEDGGVERLVALEGVSIRGAWCAIGRQSDKEGHGMGRRRRKRRRKGRTGARDASPERYLDVRVQRNPKGRRKSAKVTKQRRRNGNVTEESYEV